VLGEGARQPTAHDGIRLPVDGAGRGDDIATIGEEIDTGDFLAGDVQAGRQAEVQVGQAASGGVDGAGFEQVGIAAAEIGEGGCRVEVEDDELADGAGDDAQRRADAGIGEPRFDLGEGGRVVLVAAPRTGGNLRAGGVKVAVEGNDRIAEG